MHRLQYLIVILMILMAVGCNESTGEQKEQGVAHVPQLSDSLYTQEAAMNIYAYQPLRALLLIDSAVIVGHMDESMADQCRARIYAFTQMFSQVDSLLGGPESVRFDSAQAVGERLLHNDSVKADVNRLRDVLEVLAYANRIQGDTLGWIKWSRQLVDVCHKIGSEAETDALRTEAEIASAFPAIGRYEDGMERLDSVIALLSTKGTFDGLDALVIALKRKIALLGSRNRYAETLPLSRQIIERLDDYEAHPDQYHDGSHREPTDSVKRADYIRFYRNQAQSFLTAAYASLGEQGNMIDAFCQIENSVRASTAREHVARYNALQQQMEAERHQTRAARANLRSVAIGCLAFFFLVIAVIVLLKNRTISRKNRLLAEQITEGIDYKEKYWEEKRQQIPAQAPADLNVLTDEQLFQYVNEVVVRDRLYLDSRFGRQTLIDTFQLSKERIGAMFSKGCEYSNLSDYVKHLRLQYATKLLVEQPQKSIEEIATDCGFNSHKYFSDRFRQLFSMTPTEFRRARQ